VCCSAAGSDRPISKEDAVVVLTVTLALAVSLGVSAGQDNGSSNQALPVMSGVVKDITPIDVTVIVGDNVLIFKIDKSTSVTASGRPTQKNGLVSRGPYRPRTINDSSSLATTSECDTDPSTMLFSPSSCG
jgi:hypothetical protein